MVERRSEKMVAALVVGTRTALESAGDRVVLHSDRVVSRNPISRFLSRKKDGTRAKSLEQQLYSAAGDFERAVGKDEMLKKIEGLSLVQLSESSGYGVKWYLNTIQGEYEDKQVKIYFIKSTDWSDTSGIMNRVERWSDMRGFVDGKEIGQDAALLYKKLFPLLSERNQKDKIGDGMYYPADGLIKYFQHLCENAAAIPTR